MRVMPSVRRTPPAWTRSGSVDQFRRMILLLETAAVLEARAERAGHPTQAATWRRRAEQRLREAELIRDVLAAEGAATSARRTGSRTPIRQGAFSDATSTGRQGRSSSCS